MKKDDQFFRDLQRYLAISAIGPSALRNQGSKGVIRAAQDYLSAMDLEFFRAEDETAFLQALDEQTETLKRALPLAAQNWGAARKALNLFLRDVYWNRFLYERLGCVLEEDWLEIPLDSIIAASLKGKDTGGHLPPWPGLNRLEPETSCKLQTIAKRVALTQNISRVHLDVRLWTEARDRNGEQEVGMGVQKPQDCPQTLLLGPDAEAEGGIMEPMSAVSIIRDKFDKTGRKVRIPLLKRGEFTAELCDDGILVSNLGVQPFLPWTVFQESIRVLMRNGGRAKRGDAMNSRLGDKGLSLESVEGHIAHVVYEKNIGETVFRRISPIGGILIWTGICRAERGELVLMGPTVHG